MYIVHAKTTNNTSNIYTNNSLVNIKYQNNRMSIFDRYLEIKEFRISDPEMRILPQNY